MMDPVEEFIGAVGKDAMHEDVVIRCARLVGPGCSAISALGEAVRFLLADNIRLKRLCEESLLRETQPTIIVKTPSVTPAQLSSPE